MVSKIAAAAALVGAVVAIPNDYKYASSPVAVVYETDVETITSCAPDVTDCPARPYTTPAEYVTSSTEAAYYSTPVETSTPCEETTAAVYSSPAAVYSTPVVYSTPAVYSTPEVYSTPVVYTSAAVYTPPTYSAPATYVVCSTELVTVTSCADYVTNCPADHTAVYTSLTPISTTICEESEASSLSSYWVPYTEIVSTPVIYSTPAAAESTPCEETAAGYTTPAAPYPTAPAASYPAGTATYPAGTAYPTGTGVPTTPSAYPPTFTGAASNIKAGLSVAGLGAIAALFL